ncbi:MAG: class I SAM-dependent methyltransferase [Acidimicrobiales bacterium]|jgi:hypothetical protein|nr:class I SAM-dependent methyltransferase [Actinomycetota bacterium]
MTSSTHPEYDYLDYPKTRPRDDFWGQVRRTINGRPVGQAQIDMIVAQIRTALALTNTDMLLDLACGNAALTSYLVGECAKVVGVDHSAYLVDVALEHFHRPPNTEFIVADVADYLASEPTPERFTAALCYGSFSFFPTETATRVLHLLHQRFPNVRRILLGNLPNKTYANEFYRQRGRKPDRLDSPYTQIGIWRIPAELAALAEDAGWNTTILTMPAAFFASGYRYDALLIR